MPTTLNQMTATTIAASAKGGVPDAGLMQWLLAIGLMALPFVIVLTALGFLFSFYKDKSMKQVIHRFKNNGDMETFELPKDDVSFKRGKDTHVLLPGRPVVLERHWLLGFRRAAHFFQEGISAELKIERKIYPGDDLENSEFLQAWSDSKKEQEIFKQDKDVFTLVLVGVAGLAVGALLMMIWTTQAAKVQAPGVVKK